MVKGYNKNICSYSMDKAVGMDGGIFCSTLWKMTDPEELSKNIDYV